MNPTSLLHWWPATSGLGIPVPRTEIVELAEPMDAELLMYSCAEHGPDDPEACSRDGHQGLIAAYEGRLKAAAALVAPSYPVFLRTDFVSGKHSWVETCYVPSEDEIGQHAYAVTEAHALALWMAGPSAYMRAFVVREFLDLADDLTAFNGMPIAPERRYFIEDGKVRCHHPYWSDEDNIANGLSYGNAERPADWLARLRTLNAEQLDEIELLSDYAVRVGKALSGAWSVDFALTRDGQWFLIDMAVAGESWHPEHVPSL